LPAIWRNEGDLLKSDKIMHEEIEEIETEKKEEIEPPEKHEKITHKEQKLVADIEQRIGDMETQLKRVQAEFENYRKRTDKERQMLLSAGSAVMIEKLLPILDEMEVAVNAIHHEASTKEIKAGMEMLHKKFHSLLEKEGLIDMDSLGKTFDPYLHESVQRVEGDEDDKIVEVLKKGYLFKGGVLRHAMVIVSKKNTKEEEKEKKKDN
jgi:molecular chaperone GrpE